jgi:hypothetical protein
MSKHQRYLLQPPAPVARLSPGARYDSRGFGGRAYSPAIQADEASQQQVTDATRRGVAPLSEIIDNLDARNLPPQLVQASMFAKIPVFGVPGAQLLIPKNPRRRFSFIVSNFTNRNLILFSYDKPFNSGGNIGAGIPIGACFEETNGSVSINDIWVFCNDPNETYPIWILGYEGGISNVGNKL